MKYILVLFLLLMGCQHELHDPLTRNIVFRLKLVESLPIEDKSIAAITTCKDNYCEMLVLEEYYPGCIAEEVSKLTHTIRPEQTVCYRK